MREYQVPARFFKKVMEESVIVDKYKDPITGQFIVHRIVTKTFNLDDANDSVYGSSNFNLGRVPGGSSSTRSGGAKSEENAI